MSDFKNENKKEIEDYSNCFVIGAGSSCDFGYPTGLELIANIQKKLADPSPDLLGCLIDFPSVKSYLSNRGFAEKPLEKFCKELSERAYTPAIVQPLS